MTTTPSAGALHDPDRLEALRRTGLLDSGSETSFDRLAELARRVVGAPIALVSMVDTDRQYFKSCPGLPEPFASARSTPLSHSICQHALDGAAPLRIDDTRNDPRLVGNLAPSELGAAAYLGIPVASRDGHVLGTFCVIDTAPRAWTDADVELMVDLAGAVSSEIALRESVQELAAHARRSEMRRSRTERLSALAEALAAASSVDQIVGHVADLAAPVVDAGFANVALVDPEGAELELRHGRTLADEISARWPRIPLDEHTPLGAAILTGETVILRRAEEIRHRFPGGADDAESAGFRSLAACAVRDRSAAVGFAWTVPLEPAAPLRGLLQAVTELVGQALERARTADRQRGIALELQRNMLPTRLATVPGVDVAARYEPGMDALEVGGDWFDIGELESGHQVVAVGDIVGHGVESAAAMGQMRAAFSALVANAVDLLRLTTRLDRWAAANSAVRLSTAVLAELAVEDGSLRVVSAGHVPAMVVRCDGSVEQLPATGPPLGFDPDLDRTASETVLLPGEALVLSTDGLVERRGESIDDGLDRLERALGAAVVTTADALCDEVFDALGTDEDDAALLVLRLTDVTGIRDTTRRSPRGR